MTFKIKEREGKPASDYIMEERLSFNIFAIRKDATLLLFLVKEIVEDRKLRQLMKTKWLQKC